MEMNVGLKNKYEFILTDVKTGEVKQRAEAYNLITNVGFNKLINQMASPLYNGFYVDTEDYNSSDGGWAHDMNLGTGTGTPSVSDTALFTYGTFKVSTYDSGYVASDNKSGWAKLKAIWQVTEGNGKSYSEVGLNSTRKTLNTHAMIKDSSGNNISITKTDADVLTVYVTIYWSITYAFTDINFLLLGGTTGTNFLARLLSFNDGSFCGPYYSNNINFYYGDSNTTPSYSDLAIKGTQQFYDSFKFDDSLHSVIADTTNRKVTFRHSIYPSEANGKIIKEVYVSVKMLKFTSTTNRGEHVQPFFRLVFPCANFSGTQINKDELHQLDINFTLTFSEVT
ncbi:MAG: hypothetical protein ACYDG2_01230 [Ruminiclostridium sp.]